MYMMIIELDDELEEELDLDDDYDSDANYYYTIYSEQEFNHDYEYVDENPQENLY